MTFLASLFAPLLARFAGKSIADWARVLLPLAAAIALAIAFVVHGNHRYHAGVAAERARTIAAQRKAEDDQRAREAAAATRRFQEITAATARDAASQKEITDATSDLPDARPSARARARICAELQQRARATGGVSPACGHVRPR